MVLWVIWSIYKGAIMKQVSATHVVAFVMYDGMNNSVFQSQVLVPIKQMLAEFPLLHVLLISCEKNPVVPPYFGDRIKVVICKKRPFFSKHSLLWKEVSRVLHEHGVMTVIARGPLAGFIVMRAAPLAKVIVQARGLAAEEFRYAPASGIKGLLKPIIYRLYKQVERDVYRRAMVEAVSPALKQYLEQNFGATSVTVSYDDIPPVIDKASVQKWRHEVRAELNIPSDAYVYCYAGSAHAWQCVDEMVAFVAERLDPNVFFLFLSAEKEVFEAKLRGISARNYVVLSVTHQDMYRYVSAADAGLLFRKADVVNWVSRPTKMLEYQAVGLHIVHNGTIAWLC
jgi:hypothetical protein